MPLTVQVADQLVVSAVHTGCAPGTLTASRDPAGGSLGGVARAALRRAVAAMGSAGAAPR
jgi:hypothetical protein